MCLEESQDRQVEVVAAVEEHEVDRLGEIRQCVKRVTGAYLGEIGKTGISEILPRELHLVLMTLARDECSAATVADRGCKIEMLETPSDLPNSTIRRAPVLTAST